MENFVFNSSTRVIFGRGTENGVGEEIRSWGGKKVLVHYGSESARRSGLLDRVERSLSEAGLEYEMLGGVVPNPHIGKAREGIALCKEKGLDFILAVGGGSVIDSAKAIAYGVKYQGDVWEIYDRRPQYPIEDALPLGSIVTIAAAGSETSSSSVLTDETTLLKRGYKNELSRPKFAIMNPELTCTLPPYQTACGVTDIMMHTFERFFTPRAHNHMSDMIAVAVLRNVIDNGRLVMKDPQDYQARSEILWASNLSHNDLTGLGKAEDWATHQLEHELGGMFNVAHGAGLAAVWGSWARYVYKMDIMRFVEYAAQVWNVPVNHENYEETALTGICLTEQYFESIGMPVSIPQLLGRAITEDEIEQLASSCMHFGRRKIGSFRILDKDDAVQIYRMANC